MATNLSLAAIKAAGMVSAARTVVPKNKCLFLGTAADKPYLPYLKNMFNGLDTYVLTDQVTLLFQLEAYCKNRGVNKVVSTNVDILTKLVEIHRGAAPSSVSLDNFAGSLFTHKELEIVFVDPLKQIMTVPYGRYLTSRYISKLVAPASWVSSIPFSWDVGDASNLSALYERFQDAYLIAIDIETLKTNLAIRCIGFCAVFSSPNGNFTSHTVVIPLTDTYLLSWVRKFASLPAAKITQNGKYDFSYLLRYNIIAENWLWDTAHMMHAWYSELPKDLAFLNSLFIRNAVYWKDLANTSDLKEYYKYNALDCWATANIFIQMISQMPEWAKKNYVLEFPLVYPCLLAEMTGIERDMDRLYERRAVVDAKEQSSLTSLRRMLAHNTFNPNSPLQVKLLLKGLGCGDLESTNEKDIDKAKLRHPLNNRILSKVLEVRGYRKLATTYLRTYKDAVASGIHMGEKGGKEFRNRILYALNPHATDTGRLASKEHHFWCGLNIQNIPTPEDDGFSPVKETLKASGDFYLGECDLEQAESRDTAHISGEESLIEAVSGTRDFHSVNCSSFFGIPYTDIYDDDKKKAKNKPLRNLAKRVNHGANYNMGAKVLVSTMGLDKIAEAGRLLKLPYTDPIAIAEYLLGAFHKTYPKIKGAYYVSVINEIGTTHKLTSRAYHHTTYNLANYDAKRYIDEGDWTRYCFGDPAKNKLDLNSYVAHCPQSLNSRTLNEAFLKVFYDIALPNPTTFRLHAQIHDSILFSYTDPELPNRVKECMEIPVTVRDVSGNYRTFTVPAALKLGSPNQPAKYWSETE